MNQLDAICCRRDCWIGLLLELLALLKAFPLRESYRFLPIEQLI